MNLDIEGECDSIVINWWDLEWFWSVSMERCFTGWQADHIYNEGTAHSRTSPGRRGLGTYKPSLS